MTRENKYLALGGGIALIAFVMWRNSERAKLRVYISNDPRAVLIGDIDEQVRIYLPMLSLKTAEVAWKELSPKLLPIPAGWAKPLQTGRQLLELLTDKEHGVVKLDGDDGLGGAAKEEEEGLGGVAVENPPAPAEKPLPDNVIRMRAHEWGGNRTAERIPEGVPTAEGVFGPGAVGASDSTLSFEEWASKYPSVG